MRREGTEVTLSRGQFLQHAHRASVRLHQEGLASGDRLLMGFGENRPEDLVIRAAAIHMGIVPVTLNWQADDLAKIREKAAIAEVKACVVHPSCPWDFRDEALAHIATISWPAFPMSEEELRSHSKPLPVATPSGTQVRGNTPRIVIFTSGTTGSPKGVLLTTGSYDANRSTFESFLNIAGDEELTLVLTNPLHHANSTAMADWAMRRPRTRIVMLDRYGKHYWKALCAAATKDASRVIAPAVSRHFDFLDSLVQRGELPIPQDVLERALRRVTFLVGSAPVGPTTTDRLRHWTGRAPTVRFGSTELCLQALGIPLSMDGDEVLSAFRRGWEHTYGGQALAGYYIGKAHPPWTEASIVKSTQQGDAEYLVPAEDGEPGQLIVKSHARMAEYLNAPEATEKALEGEWYLGLGDVAFALAGQQGEAKDVYWVSRTAGLIIRGGANYACEQLRSELMRLLGETFDLQSDSVDVAVLGLKLNSEHEDTCCVCIELKDPKSREQQTGIEQLLMSAPKELSKAARPDRLVFANIPRNFKGAIDLRDLKSYFTASETNALDNRSE